MHTDYPFDQQSGKWQNANQYYAVSSSTKIKELYGDLGTNVDNMICTNAWSGSQTLVYDSSSCQYVNVPAYPFQFKVIDYPSTWAISKYGPNKFRNEKIRHIDQSVEARFDDKGRSTYVSNSDVAPDSNQVGLFVDPQDFKNRDIVRYFGNYDFMNVIGDPTNQYSSSYDSLKLLRRQYSDFRSQFSGSKTLFGELSILYKLYFNKAVFDTIKQVIPTRTNILTGMVIEPTILERPKYQSKPIVSELNTGDAFYTDIPLLHYFRDSSSKIVMISTSVDSGDNIADVSAADIYFPTIDYPVNYGGNYAASSPDPYSMGHFDDSILTYGDINTNIFLAPEANFYADNLSPEPGSSVRFINLSRFRSNYNSPWKTDDLSYFWEFGSGSLTSRDINPTFTYSTQGKYTVTLTTTHITPITLDESLNTIIRTEYIECKRMTPTIDFTSSVTTVYSGDPVKFTNLSQNATSYFWDFGSGSLTSTETNPIITYGNGGLYTVKLQGVRIDAPAEKIKTNYINVIQSLYCGADITGTKGYPVRSVIQLPNTGAFFMYFTPTSVKPVRMSLYCDSKELLTTGWYCAYDNQKHDIYEQNKSELNQYLMSKGSGSENPEGLTIDVGILRGTGKRSSTRDIELFVYAPLDGSTWKFKTECDPYAP